MERVTYEVRPFAVPLKQNFNRPWLTSHRESQIQRYAV